MTQETFSRLHLQSEKAGNWKDEVVESDTKQKEIMLKKTRDSRASLFAPRKYRIVRVKTTITEP